MIGAEGLRWVILLWTSIAAVTAGALLKIAAPYGRHARSGWGPAVPAPVAWMVMEAPSPVLMMTFFIAGHRHDAASTAFLALWVGHYVYRSFVFPLLGAGRKAPMPLSVVLFAVVFNLVNGTLNGAWLFVLGPVRGPAWLADPRFMSGFLVFLAGFFIHVRADAGLRALRAPGAGGYTVPRGGLFERVSCPNYLGEIVEWCGYALLTWSISALSFAAWTAANLVPRALAHHRWYGERFEDYPPERKAIVPGLL
ncbi:MAG TPA: DUF1295 domain-containing protein [Candidatus Polarisedimenticolaceae bacterium]|nr:DUF1295 domain-containing protein [Candidatus Polarisedimenticolaceae bacterium]